MSDWASSLEDGQVSLGACRESFGEEQDEALTDGRIVEPAPSSSGNFLWIVCLQIPLSPVNTEVSCIKSFFSVTTHGATYGGMEGLVICCKPQVTL